MKPFLSAYDLDHTLITVNSSYQFCRFLYGRKIITHSEFLHCHYYYFRFKFFHLPLLELHQKVFNFTFSGKHFEVLHKNAVVFVNQFLKKDLYRPMIIRLEAALKNHCCLILSNSPEFLVGLIAKELGVKYWKGTEYELDGEGRLINVKAILDGRAKKEYLLKFSQLHGISNNAIHTYSDSHHDLPFLEVAQHPVAVQPDRKLYQIARKKGWEIISGY